MEAEERCRCGGLGVEEYDFLFCTFHSTLILLVSQSDAYSRTYGGPTQNCVAGRGVVVVKEWMKHICPVFHSRNSLLPQLGTLSTHFFFPQTRDCTTFTLHYLIKINYHSCFHNRWPDQKRN